MLSEKMNDALNIQANRELYSSYLYLAMSYYFESINMKGFAHWMRLQAGEELVHTMRMLDYAAGKGGRAKMMAVEAPQFTWTSPLQAFQTASWLRTGAAGPPQPPICAITRSCGAICSSRW